MSRKLVSSKLLLSNQQNPFTPVAKVAVDNHAKLVAIKNNIRRLVKENGLLRTPNNVDLVKLIKLMGKDFEEGKQIFRSMRLAEPDFNQRHIPVPPPMSELYDRVVVGQRVLDVGSGNGLKLISFSKQVKLRTCYHHCNSLLKHVNHLRKTFQKSDLQDEIVTSRMALSQNKDISEFDNVDGLHVVPNLSEMAAYGYSSRKEDGSYVTVSSKETFVDYEHGLPSQSLGTFYRGVNTYADCDVNLQFTDKIELPGVLINTSEGQRPLYKVPILEPTVKLDGMLYALRIGREKALLQARGTKLGSVCKTSFKSTAFLLLERYKDDFHLVRIKEYKGFRPFHSLSCLEYFLQKVRLSIDGRLVKPPIRFPSNIKGEGLVSRIKGIDYLVRYHRSFDVARGCEGSLVSLLHHFGVTCQLDGKGTGPINEFILEGNILRFHKERPDKTTPDSKKKIKEIIATYVLGDDADFTPGEFLDLEQEYGDDSSVDFSGMFD